MIKDHKTARLFIICSLTIFIIGSWASSGHARDVYSLFGKLFLSGRVEYDFTDTRDFLTDTEAQQIEKNRFDFDRLFRRGFHSVLTIEETSGNVKNILSLGDIPTKFTSYSFNQVDLEGVRWDVRSERSDISFLMVPGPINPVIGQDVPDSGVGIRQVTKLDDTKIGMSWYFRQTPVFGIDTEINFANYGIKGEFALTPKSALGRSLEERFQASAAVFKAFRTVGDLIIQGEAFRIGHRYDASRSVNDNDDQDRYTDNTEPDPPSRIIPGDLDKNDNGIFDYEDDVLLFDVDEDFLDERDRNNNGIRDEEENDHDPDYEFDVGLRGLRSLLEYKTAKRGQSTELELGAEHAKNLKTENSATKLYASLIHERELPDLGLISVENELKYVKDNIPDDTWHYAGFLNREDAEIYRAQEDVEALEETDQIGFIPVGGGAEVERKREDPLLMQNDLINTAKLTFSFTKIKKIYMSLRAKLQYDADFDPGSENEHYEVGIFKTNYRIRPSKSLEIIPMFKYTIRNGFKIANEQKETRTLTKKDKEGNLVEYNIRLKTIQPAEIRDQSQAYILKTVYQFTKTIKITGGIQLLMFNDMIDDKRDFVRQALLGELEKNFVAYEKDLFLHIGVRYIDQRAVGKINDQNFMETFVRVFAKF